MAIKDLAKTKLGVQVLSRSNLKQSLSASKWSDLVIFKSLENENCRGSDSHNFHCSAFSAPLNSSAGTVCKDSWGTQQSWGAFVSRVGWQMLLPASPRHRGWGWREMLWLVSMCCAACSSGLKVTNLGVSHLHHWRCWVQEQGSYSPDKHISDTSWNHWEYFQATIQRCVCSSLYSFRNYL